MLTIDCTRMRIYVHGNSKYKAIIYQCHLEEKKTIFGHINLMICYIKVLYVIEIFDYYIGHALHSNISSMTSKDTRIAIYISSLLIVFFVSVNGKENGIEILFFYSLFSL
jgi:hypothetical protein